MHELGFLVAHHHDLGHVHEPPCQRERAYGTGEHRAVVDQGSHLGYGLHVQSRAPYTHRGHHDAAGVGVLVDERAHHRGNLVIAYDRLRSERLRLHGQIHERHRGRCRIPLRNKAHGLSLVVRRPDEVAHRDAHQLHGRKREHRQRLLPLRRNDAGEPLPHIHGILPLLPGTPPIFYAPTSSAALTAAAPASGVYASAPTSSAYACVTGAPPT